MMLHPTSFLIHFNPKPGTCGLPTRERLSQCLSSPAGCYDNKRYRLQTEGWRFTMLNTYWENMFRFLILGFSLHQLELNICYMLVVWMFICFKLYLSYLPFIILSLSLFLSLGPRQGVCGICYFAKSGSPQICEEGLWLHFNGGR